MTYIKQVFASIMIAVVFAVQAGPVEASPPRGVVGAMT